MKLNKVHLPVLLIAALLFLPACALFYSVGMPFVYDSAKLKDGESHLDLLYKDPATEFVDSVKNRLDLYTPGGTDWPVLVFAHGGGWSSGDKALTVGGKEVYRNIGRYFAERGIGTAVINYRLLPGVHWRTQINDVAAAIEWTYRHAPAYGGDTTRFFVSGHSAGAHLVARTATDPEPLRARGASKSIIDGVISVSGGGYDMTDSTTYALGAEFEYLEERYGVVDKSGDWVAGASVVQFVDAASPPMLFFAGGKEHPSFERQARLMMKKLEENGIVTEFYPVKGATHPYMILRMSKDGNALTDHALRFIRETPPSR